MGKLLVWLLAAGKMGKLLTTGAQLASCMVMVSPCHRIVEPAP